MGKTVIGWTKVTWNPVTGCSRVDADCINCYAEALSLKRGWSKFPWTGNHAEQNVVLHPDRLRAPYKLKEPTRIFVNSMSDLFHELVPDEFIRQIWNVMLDTPQHVYQILTKRPERAATWPGPWAPNIWMGTSVGHKRAKYRLEALRSCQTQIRWVSFEPLWEDVDLQPRELDGFQWAVVGGESGPNFRQMLMAWARKIRDHCQEYDPAIAFFYKQDSAYRTETRSYLVEEDGSRWKWEQYPGELTPPIHLGGLK